MAHLMRTRFAKDIVTEVAIPTRKGKRTRAIILCDGAPSIPRKQELAEWLARKGFWVFYPRYRGSWESGGVFLAQSPEEDVLAVIDGMAKGFTSVWDGAHYKVKPDELFIIGTSFGGPAAILASRDPRVMKIVAVSPVVDWRAPSKAEPPERFVQFTRDGFGEAYRCGKREFAKLTRGIFYNPVRHTKEINGKKMFIIHAKDDDVVRYREVAKFAKATGATFVSRARGGHLSATKMTMHYWKRIDAFFRAK